MYCLIVYLQFVQRSKEKKGEERNLEKIHEGEAS